MSILQTGDASSSPTDSKLQIDSQSYKQKLYEFIPISPALIDHVRRLDGFNVGCFERGIKGCNTEIVVDWIWGKWMVFVTHQN